MIFLVIFRKFKTTFFFIIYIMKRCFCCFTRKNYCDDDHLPVIAEFHNSSVGNQECSNNGEWDMWDGPSSIVCDNGENKKLCLSPEAVLQQQIREYRLNQQKKLLEQNQEKIDEEPNYFADLVPKITKKPQVLVFARQEDEQQLSNRFLVSDCFSQQNTNELGDWTEEEKCGWEQEACDEIDVDATLREQKRIDREKRKVELQKKKAEKELRVGTFSKLATKIS